MAGLRHGQVGPPFVDNIGEKYRVICAVNDDLFTEKNQDTDNKTCAANSWRRLSDMARESFVVSGKRPAVPSDLAGSSKERRCPARRTAGASEERDRRPHGRSSRRIRQVARPADSDGAAGRRAGRIAAARPSRERGSARSAAPACRRAVLAESRGCGSPQCARLGSLGECRHRSDVGDGGGVTARSPGRGAVTGSEGVRSAERHAAGKRFRPLTPPFFFRAIPLSAPAPRSPPRARRGDGRSRHAASRSACRRRGRCPYRPRPPRHGRR
jgi:hypothetical protein